MLDRKQLSDEAAYLALTFRKRLGAGLEEAISPIDGAEGLGIEVRLIDLPSMEGVYMAGKSPAIVLSSMRPQGRRHFTCAHEIGHHAFGHGQQFDEIVDQRRARRTVDPKEFSADCFASYFLMPKATVDSGMVGRGFVYGRIQAVDAYAMASWLGVGYRTFVNHLQYGLRAIGPNQAEALRKWEPTNIRAQIVGAPIKSNLHIVDHAWIGRAVDCEVGDFLLLPHSTLCEGAILTPPKALLDRVLVRVKSRGIARVSGMKPFWGAFVRASAERYIGRARYRFDEEIPDDDPADDL